MKLSRPWLRVSGLALLIGCLALYDPEASGAVQDLLIPLAMALAAWAMVQNLAAVSLGVAVLALIHSDPSAPGWVEGRAYPLLTLAAGITFAAIVLSRFRQRVRDTHQARWAERRER